MEQRAKADWKEELLGKNPYANLPRMNILTYDISDIDSKFSAYTEDKYFNFREFFRVNDGGDFVHKSDVTAFLNLLCKKDDNSNYPFSTAEYRTNFKHSFWLVPGVKAAKALSQLIQEHPTLSAFHVVNVAGDGDDNQEYDYEKEKKALDDVKKSIKNYPDGTITISCGRLTTGVTVPEWTAVFMLAGSYSTAASSYMQTIFRVQSPANINGRIKEECYVFDFAPDRTLKVLAEAVKISAQAGKTTHDDRETMEEFLKFCPIISVTGSKMSTYDVGGMLQQLKRVYIDRAVRTGFEDNSLFNQELLNLDDIDMKKFDALKKIVGSKKSDTTDLRNIIVTANGMEGDGETPVNKEPKEPRPEPDPEKSEAKKRRDAARSILKAIAIRIPMLIYGSDTPIDTKIDIDKFIDIVDDISWAEFMPNGVDKEVFRQFSKYFDMEIFIGAGNEIRNRIKHADTLEPTERVKYIAQMFACFKNPDKETVLTPWRVVNMHMSDCLGGYDFFNEDHTEFLIDDGSDPRYVDVPDVTDEVFGPADTKILEINSKSGLYPLYVTYTLWRKRCDTLKISPKVTEEHPEHKDKLLEIWDDVIQKNVYIICKTPMAKSITQRTLCGYRNVKINAHAFENLVTMIKDGKSKKFRERATSGDTYNSKNKEKDMKFNAIVGNPPYQVDDGGFGASASPIYQHFVQQAKMINPDFMSMIIPSRWVSGGKGLDDFRQEMLADERLRRFHDYTGSSMVFPNVDIKGGICYFLWDTDHNGDCTVSIHDTDGTVSTSSRKLSNDGLFVRYSELLSILDKVKAKNEDSLSKIVSVRKPYGFCTDLFKSPEKYKLPPLSTAPIKGGIKIHGLLNLKRTERWVNIDYPITVGRDSISKYKIFIPNAYGCGAIGEQIPTPILATPMEIATETFLLIGPFDTKEIATNALSYLKTKFFRTLVGLKKISQHTSKTTYSCVPLQNFTDSSDIDWSKSVAEIDQQLYAKYNLTDEEISFIESMIKPME